MPENTAPKLAPTKSKRHPANDHLPKAVAEHYEVVEWHGGHEQNFGKFGMVNLKTLTLTRAGQFVAQKFSKLRAKK